MGFLGFQRIFEGFGWVFFRFFGIFMMGKVDESQLENVQAAHFFYYSF